MLNVGVGYFITLSIRHDSIRIIEDEYYDNEELIIKRIDDLCIELGENVIHILKTRANANGEKIV